MQRRERARGRDFVDRAASQLAIVVSVKITAELCRAIEISIGTHSQGRAPGDEAIVAVGLGAKAIQRRHWLPRTDLKESAATEAGGAAIREIRRAALTGRAIEFSVGSLDQTIRSGPVSAVGHQAKTVKLADLARRSHSEERSAGRGGPIRTPVQSYAVEVSVEALQ